MTTVPQNWTEWAAKYGEIVKSQRAKNSPVSYEWEFAGSVLRHVSGLPASRVVPQQEFVGENGQILHMDFGIEVNGHKIAIEVEGFDKTGTSMGKTKAEHNNWAARQRALQAQGWKVIAITNKDFMTNPVKYQRIIEDAMTTSPNPAPTPSSQPVIVKVEYEAHKQPEPTPATFDNKKGWSTGSILATTAGAIGLVVAALFFFANSNSYTPPVFPNPANPDCDDFSTRFQLNEWAKRNPEKFASSYLDGADADLLACEDFKYPDD